jgi:hypothetical protein
MSQERRKRQQEREGTEQPNLRTLGYIVVAIVIVAGFAAAYHFIRQGQTSRLDAFAKCLTAKQAKMYGLYSCSHCQDQKEKFGSSVDYIPYIECGIKGSHAFATICTEANVKQFPTWVFADGTRVVGAQGLDFLAQRTGCSLP